MLILNIFIVAFPLKKQLFTGFVGPSKMNNTSIIKLTTPIKPNKNDVLKRQNVTII